MQDKKKLIEYVIENNGMITTDRVEDFGYSRGSLKYMADLGELEKVSRGVYILPDTFEDEYVIFQNRFKKGIFSNQTALFLHGLTDRTPANLHMTFPKGYNTSSPKSEGIICDVCKKEIYELGIRESKTPFGNMIRTYNAERTLCDLLKTKNHTDIQIIAEAFKSYLVRKDRNISLLSEYAKKLKVDKRLHVYLEVLI